MTGDRIRITGPTGCSGVVDGTRLWWSPKYRHCGASGPTAYYPDGPYRIEGWAIDETPGCHAVGITHYSVWYADGITDATGSSGGWSEVEVLTGTDISSCCFIQFKTDPDFLSSQVVYELQDIDNWRVEAYYTNPNCLTGNVPIDAVNGQLLFADTCCYEGCPIKYMVVSGDFPPDMMMNMDSGEMTGFISEMDLPDNPDDPEADYFLKQYTLPPGYRVNEQNYATVGSAASFWHGNPGYAIAKFVVRAFDPGNPRVFADQEFQFKVMNNWSSDRDRLILNIDNQFYIDGVTATNAEYLARMKQLGYFPKN